MPPLFFIASCQVTNAIHPQDQHDDYQHPYPPGFLSVFLKLRCATPDVGKF